MARSEKSVMNETLVEVSSLPDSLFYRQNTGTAWQGRDVTPRAGEYVRVEPGMKVLAAARPISFGVPGCGDITGVYQQRAIQIELKTLTGAQRGVQLAFERQWVKAGGIYVLARSAEEALNRLR